MWERIRGSERLEVAKGVFVVRKIKNLESYSKTLDWLPPARRVLKIIGPALTPVERRAVKKFFLGAQVVYEKVCEKCGPVRRGRD